MAGERQGDEEITGERTSTSTPYGGLEPGGGATGDRPGAPQAAPEPPGPRATAAGRVWVTLAFSLLVLIALIIFIAQNTREVTVNFLGLHGTIATGLALLIAAVAGAIVTLLAGSARILQLRSQIKNQRRGH